MRKYRAAAAKQAAWYSEEYDTVNYNPFRKARSNEHTLHRAQTLQFPSALSEKQSDEDVHEVEEIVVPDAERIPHASNVSNASNISNASNAKTRMSTGKPIRIYKSRDEEQGLPLPPRAFASWKSWSQQKLSYAWRQIVLACGSRRSGDVKRSFADMGMSVISHAPLGTKGAPFLQVPG